LAACNLKLNNAKTTIDACNEALKIDLSNVKAWYRKAKAKFMLNNKYDEGLADLAQAIKLEPNNEAMKSEYKELLRKKEEMKTLAPVLPL
jgi:tetratricopeptide (TPR) repeat protein